MKKFEDGGMAPAAYTYLMKLTYAWYLTDSAETKKKISEEADSFRAEGYSKITVTTSVLSIIIDDVNDNISYMSKLPNAIMYSKDHYFRNNLNIDLEWSELQKIQNDSSVPEYLKWYEEGLSTYHQHNTVDGEASNVKYVSNDGHFEVVYNKNYVLQTIVNNPEDMGTYNYCGPNVNKAKHAWLDVIPYYDYDNTLETRKFSQTG